MDLQEYGFSTAGFLLGRRERGDRGKTKNELDAGVPARACSRGGLLLGVSVLAGLFSSSAAYAQAAQQSPPVTSASRTTMQRSGSDQIPEGTTICAVLEKTVDAKKAKPGEVIVAKTTLAVVAHGKVVIANGAMLKGHVTEAKARSRDDRESRLGIMFDRVVMKGGAEMPVELTVQAVGYGGLTASELGGSGANANAPYAPAATTAADVANGGSRRSGFPPPRPEPSDTPLAETPGRPSRAPVLDAGSKGAVGLTGLTLTEGTDAKEGSVISATKKNVKLERGSQLILRVMAPANGPETGAR